METSIGLLQRLRDEPDKAWLQMFNLYGPWLKRWFVRWDSSLGSEVDDLLQNVMAVVVRDIASFRREGGGKFRGWLKTIAVNCLRHHQRTRRRQPRGQGQNPENDILAQVEDPNSELSQQWDREHDRYLIKRLLEFIETEFNSNDLHAFRRLMFDGASAAEVATELKVTVNVVYLARSRILNRLREEGQDFLT